MLRYVCGMNGRFPTNNPCDILNYEDGTWTWHLYSWPGDESHLRSSHQGVCHEQSDHYSVQVVARWM